jgi:AGZA family xanthine/uracil permease-like MFS transporter
LIIPLTFSIADGVAAGFIAHAVAKVALGDWHTMRSSLILAAISIAYFA